MDQRYAENGVCCEIRCGYICGLERCLFELGLGAMESTAARNSCWSSFGVQLWHDMCRAQVCGDRYEQVRRGIFQNIWLKCYLASRII